MSHTGFSIFGNRNRPQGTQPPVNNTQGGGNNNNNNNNNNQGGNTDNKQGGDNKGANATNDGAPDDQIVDDIWKAVKDDPAPAGNQGGNQGGNNQGGGNAPAAKTPDQIMSGYLAKVGIKPVELSDADLTAIQNGDTSSLKRMLADVNEQVKTAHIASIRSANELVKTSVKQAVDDAVAKSRTFVEGKEYRGMLNSALPFTANPLIQPFAETVMQRFLDKGLSPQNAVKAVGQYFEKTYGAMVESMGEEMNTNFSGSYRGSPQKKGDVDWLALLRE
jgi:hypothetical protein